MMHLFDRAARKTPQNCDILGAFRTAKAYLPALNIKLHPHSPELYDEYLQTLYDLRTPIRIRGDRFGIITLLDRREADQGLIKGFLRTFTKVLSDVMHR